MSGRYRCAFDDQDCRFQSEDPAEVAKHVDDTGHGRCVIDAASLTRHERQTCTKCLGQVRRDLRDIADLYALLPATLGHLGSNAPRRDTRTSGDGSDRLPGGDALVMLAGGSEGARWAWPNPVLYPTVNDNSPHDPPPVAYELARYVQDWSRLRSEPPITSLPTVAESVRFLAWERCEWAARWHPNFASVASELRAMHAALVRGTGTGDPPDVTDARCLYCVTARLRKVWGKTEDDDRWECPRCFRSGSKAHYLFAVVATIRAQRGEAS